MKVCDNCPTLHKRRAAYIVTLRMRGMQHRHPLHVCEQHRSKIPARMIESVETIPMIPEERETE